jgi:hypothetical protein
VKPDALDLYKANLAVQRRTRIVQRQRRIQLLEGLLRITPEEDQQEVLNSEIGILRAEIEAEGADT